MSDFECKLMHGDSVEKLKELGDSTIDMVMTSPPYDDLRNYDNSCAWNFDMFCKIAKELYRVVKDGGVIIWVVGDKTDKGSESGTSFRQALYFKEIGFRLHDTMIYRKANIQPLTHNRYEQEFEYMFCFSKGKPKTFNPIKVPCKYAGQMSWGKVSFYKTADDNLTDKGQVKIGDYKIKGNIFTYRTGSSTESSKFKHPAMFPTGLAKDQIESWTNEGDTVLDPFMGSGTTGYVAKTLGRNFVGIELVDKYFTMASERLETCLWRSNIFSAATEGIVSLMDEQFSEMTDKFRSKKAYLKVEQKTEKTAEETEACVGIEEDFDLYVKKRENLCSKVLPPYDRDIEPTMTLAEIRELVELSVNAGEDDW